MTEEERRGWGGMIWRYRYITDGPVCTCRVNGLETILYNQDAPQKKAAHG